MRYRIKQEINGSASIATTFNRMAYEPALKNRNQRSYERNASLYLPEGSLIEINEKEMKNQKACQTRFDWGLMLKKFTRR